MSISRQKKGFISTLGYFFIASRYCNICFDYQINHRVAEPIRRNRVGQFQVFQEQSRSKYISFPPPRSLFRLAQQKGGDISQVQ